MTQIRGSVEDIMAHLIEATHSNEVAGASTSSQHPHTGGTLMMFYFHPDASEQDMKNLLIGEIERTLDILDPTRKMPTPPKDFRNMN